MKLATEKGKQEALRQLNDRRENAPEKINNASLLAGSEMTFYCRTCGHVSDTLPECYVNPPKRLCKECQAMKDAGWLE